MICCLTFPIEKLQKLDTSKLKKLTIKEYRFFKELHGDFYTNEEMKYLILEEMLFKTFLSELNKVLKKNGYEKINTNVTEMISYFGDYHFGYIEEFIFCYMEDLKKGAEEYFNYFY